MDRQYLRKQVKVILDNADLEGLLALGAPQDEYDQEVALIESGIDGLRKTENVALTENQIADVVANVWSQQFGPFSDDEMNKRRPHFVGVARRIVALL
jgi:hypothetical protein